ncbi:MAG: hypothetical protein ABR613_04885, partial [Actinomycetota bacterium]
MAVTNRPAIGELRNELRSVARQLRAARASLNLGPISLTKAQKHPDIFASAVAALKEAPDPSRPSTDLAQLLAALETSRKKTKPGYVIPSAEGNWVTRPPRPCG